FARFLHVLLSCLRHWSENCRQLTRIHPTLLRVRCGTSAQRVKKLTKLSLRNLGYNTALQSLR
ncbi:hypothetical protein, partial [Nostoc favosum]